MADTNLNIKVTADTSNAQANLKGFASGMADVKAGLDFAKEAIGTFADVFKTAFAMGKEGAVIIQTADSLTRLAKEAGYAGDLIGDLEKAAGGTVDDLDYMGSALKTLTGTSGELQTNLAQNLPAFLNISRAVVKLNPTLGDTADVFDAITRALQTGQTRGLKPYGFQIDATASAVDQMNQIMEQGAAMVEKLGGNVESAVDPFNRLENSIDNVKDTIMTGLAPALTAAAEGANTLLTAYDTTTASLATHNQELINTAMGYAAYTEEMERSIDASGLVLGTLGVRDEKQKILTETEYAAAVALAAENQELAANAQYAGELSQALTTQLIPAQTEAADAADKVAEAHQRQATAFAEAHTASTLLDGAIDGLAASYDPANTAANLLKDTIDLLTDSQAEANRLLLDWAIQQKLAQINTEGLTEAERRQLSAELELMLNQQTEIENMETLNELLSTGAITREDARLAMADHKITTEELNALMGAENELIAENTEALFLQEEQTRKGTDAQQAFIDKTPEMISSLDFLASSALNAAGDYEINFKVNVYGDPIPNISGGGGAGTSVDDTKNNGPYGTSLRADTGTTGATTPAANNANGDLLGQMLAARDAMYGGASAGSPRAAPGTNTGGRDGGVGMTMPGGFGQMANLGGVPVMLTINYYNTPPSVIDDLQMVAQMAQTGA